MSLVDALLLEPYRDPREIYIALRTDGLKGSGTIVDPYDGSTRLGLPVDAEITCERREFAVALLGHNLSVGNSVTIHGVKGPSEARFNITAQVKRVLSPAHFTLQASDSPNGPPTIPPAVQDYPDVIRAALPGVPVSGANPIVRLYWPIAIVTVPSGHGLGVLDAVSIGGSSLPVDYAGEYPILGPDVPAGNVFAYRLRFRPGADIMTGTTPDHLDCTVTRISHRFDEVMRSVPLNSVIRVGPGTFETRGFASTHVSHASDFSQLFTGYILRAGQRLLGSGVGVTTLKLVLPHDEVTQTTAVSNPNSPNATYAEVFDLNIDCNASGHVAPYGVFPAPVTCGAVELGGRFMCIRRVRAINFCVQAMPECFALAMRPSADGPATFNVLEDCIVEQPGKNNTHETTLLNSNGGHRASGLSPIVRHNYANCSYVQDDGSAVSRAYVAVQSITQQADKELFELITKQPHHREAVNNVHLNGVDATTPSLNGAFPVVTKISETELIFKVAGTTNSLTGIGVSKAYLGVDYHGPLPGGGTGCVVEGNALFDCEHPIYSDTGSTRDSVIRDNYFSDVGQAVNFSYAGGPGSEDPRNAASLKRDASNHKVAILEFATAHGLAVGQVVTIDGARIGNPPTLDNPYNGNHRIIAVSADGSGVVRFFRYEMKEIPNPNEDASNLFLIGFRVRWQNPRHLFEGNCYDLYPYDQNSPFPSYGIGTYAYTGLPPFTVPASDPYIFPGVIIRENLIRLRDGAVGQAAGNGAFGWACRLDNFENTLVENNVIDSRYPYPVHHLNSQGVTAFNNRTPAGTHMPIYNDTSGQGVLNSFRKEDSLEDKIENALIASLL